MSKEDSGTYVCTAENSVGFVKAIGFVHVKGRLNFLMCSLFFLAFYQKISRFFSEVFLLEENISGGL